MSKDTHEGTVRGGVVYALCGKTFPIPPGSRALLFWGTCPECARIKRIKKKRRGK